MTTQDDRDQNQQARELYARRRPCPHCRKLVSLGDELGGQCPHCGGVILAWPDIRPERAAEMLAELQDRRRALGLPNV